ncbi:DUF4232 domain-containing protein [Kitasatospora sp. NBC_00240]|uniref:DUF4232 domain-containing protein n=1 Tax=Kitasatospora sp. NBC_00240 TaxID=2903567 RepID=UPI00225013A4|nr:DUF4232 domain-containing protein [Kitasatospora sp. NBC_00240]MCX5214688.1 DUF4232 domain-containing protein [Kitasatospora sp. NBC_00240]
MRVHQLTFAALAVAAGLALTACQNDDGGEAQGRPSSAATATSAATAPAAPPTSAASTPGRSSGPGSSGQGTATGSGGSATPAGSGSSGSGKSGKCRTDELEITAVERTIDGDLDGTVVVELKNRGGRDCEISGYPGADLKTTSGQLSAKRTGEPVVTGILKNGKSTFFGISYPLNKSNGSGIRITGLIVTPPDETKPVTLNWPGATTLPVTDGTGSPVKVGPIGSAGQGG